VPEARSPDPLALPRPHRHERYPTEYRAPTAVLTPAERDLLLGTGAASLAPPQACAAEERPAGWMQPPQATVSLSQPPPTGLPTVECLSWHLVQERYHRKRARYVCGGSTLPHSGEEMWCIWLRALKL